MASKGPFTRKRQELVPPIAKGSPTSLSFGALSRDGAFAWMGYEDEVALFDCETKERRAVWMFQAVNQKEEEEELTVLCIEEAFVVDKRYLVVATMDKHESSSQLRFLDIATSKTTALVNLPEPVTSMNFIGAPTPLGFIANFSSVLALGTTGGHTLLLDISFIRTNPSGSPDMGLEAVRPQFYRRDNWPAGNIPYIDLDAACHRSGVLEYPDRGGQSEAKALPEKGVLVSCLQYIPQLWCIVVGYNFGCFQLWSLFSGALLYSSPYEFEGGASVIRRVPVTKFGYQELAFHQGYGHIWVGRSSHSSPLCNAPFPASMTLYGIRFTLPNFEDDSTVKDVQLGGISEEYKLPLSCFHNNSEREKLAARIVDIIPVPIRETHFDVGLDSDWVADSAKGFGGGGASDEDLMEEDEESGIGWKRKEKELTRKEGIPKALFVWEAFLPSSLTASQPEYHMVLFDLNLVMSSAVRKGETLPGYFTSFSLSLLESPQLLGVWLNPSSITEFSTKKSGVLKELDSDISYEVDAFSLSFDISFLSEASITGMSFMGDQQKALTSLAERGPVDLSDDASSASGTMRLYVDCKKAGLLPFRPSLDSGQSENDTIYQKRCLLDVCLKHNLLSTVCQLVRKRRSDSDREYLLVGPKIVLDWAWAAFKNLEVFLTDPQCGLYADIVSNQQTHGSYRRERALTLLEGVAVRARGLHSVFLSLLSRTDNTQEGYNALQKKACAIMLFLQHLEVMTWCFKKRLLSANYPYHELSENYTVRRRNRTTRYNDDNWHVENMSGKPAQEPVSSEMTELFIDMLMALPQQFQDQQQQEGLYPVSALPSYPPKSLAALLRMFATGNPDEEALIEKKCLMYYFLLDWMHAAKLDWSVFEEFADAFNLPVHHRLLMTGFWLLDDARPVEAMERLNSVQTKILVQGWAAPIVSALHDLKDYFHALAVGNACQSALPTLRESVVQIRLLLHNDIIMQAFNFQKQYARPERETLLYHVFSFFDREKRLKELFQFAMDDVEENCLQQYLKNMGSYDPLGYEYLVLFLLSRAQYAQAIANYDTYLSHLIPTEEPMEEEEEEEGFAFMLSARKKKGKEKMKDSSTQTDKSANIRVLHAIIQNYRKILPAIQTLPPPSKPSSEVKATITATTSSSVAPIATPAPRQQLSFSLTETPILPASDTDSRRSSLLSFAAPTPAGGATLQSPTRPIRRLSFGGGGILQQKPKPTRMHIPSPTQTPVANNQRLGPSFVAQSPVSFVEQVISQPEQLPQQYYSEMTDIADSTSANAPTTSAPSPYGIPSPGFFNNSTPTGLKKRTPIRSLARRPVGILSSPSNAARRVSFTADLADRMHDDTRNTGGESDEENRWLGKAAQQQHEPQNGGYSDDDDSEADSLVSAKQRRKYQKRDEEEVTKRARNTNEDDNADDDEDEGTSRKKAAPKKGVRLAKRSKRLVRRTAKGRDMEEDDDEDDNEDYDDDDDENDEKGKGKVRGKAGKQPTTKSKTAKKAVPRRGTATAASAATSADDKNTPAHHMRLRSRRK